MRLVTAFSKFRLTGMACAAACLGLLSLVAPLSSVASPGVRPGVYLRLAQHHAIRGTLRANCGI